MHPVLEQVREMLAVPLVGASAEQVAHHPGNDPARWSTWQIVDHLSATWRATSRGIEDRLRKARPLKSHPNLQQRIAQFAVCRLGYFPQGMKAPDIVLPSSGPQSPIPGHELIAQCSATLAVMDEWLSQAEPVARRAPVLTHHVLGPLSVESWRRFHLAHALHHAPQIQRALSDGRRPT